jgi:hypothetical protein
MKSKILFICGSLNQTTIMHSISLYFDDCECYFSSYYADGMVDSLVRKGLLDFTILAGRFRRQTENYLSSNNLNIDYKGLYNDYDLVFTCQDIIVPENVRNKKLVLVQEGMTDPETVTYHLVKEFNLPRWLAGTSATGLSDAYDLFFVASEGYRELFISKGVNPAKIYVTGIPNFDNANQYLNNEFPFRNFVLAATSDRRETLNYENRKLFIQKVLGIAKGRQVIFKLHPNENWERAIREINRYAPGALVYTNANINHLIANCDVLVTAYSSVVFIGLALGKEIYSDFSLDFLQKLMPIQNQGTSACEIARIARESLLFNQKVYPQDFNASFCNPVSGYVNSRSDISI